MTIRIPSSVIYAQRPAQARSFDAQGAELGLDPQNESPAESQLGYALLRLLIDPTEFGAPGYINLFLPHGSIENADDMPPISFCEFGVINIATNVWLGDYRPDYFLQVKAPGSSHIVSGAVECDGHEFHYNTPEKVSADRQRDRDIQKAGVTVLRFPAGDILEDAVSCAREAIGCLVRQSASRSAA